MQLVRSSPRPSTVVRTVTVGELSKRAGSCISRLLPHGVLHACTSAHLLLPMGTPPSHVCVPPPLPGCAAKLQSPTVASITGSGSGGPTLTFLRPANAGALECKHRQWGAQPMGCWCCMVADPANVLHPDGEPACSPAPGTATLAWSFTLLSSNGTQVGDASRPIPTVSVTGNGVAASPHRAVLPLPDDALRSGGLFRLRLTASLAAGTQVYDSATTTDASPDFGMGKCQRGGCALQQPWRSRQPACVLYCIE